MVRVIFEAHLPVVVEQKPEWFVAHCPLLDVWSQGESEQKALDNIVEALQLFLISCFERGVLDDVLKECGFRAARPADLAEIDDTPAAGTSMVNVPLPFMIPQNAACHA